MVTDVFMPLNGQKEKETALLLREEACKQKTAQEVFEMEQQIRDLTFYAK